MFIASANYGYRPRFSFVVKCPGRYGTVYQWGEYVVPLFHRICAFDPIKKISSRQLAEGLSISQETVNKILNRYQVLGCLVAKHNRAVGKVAFKRAKKSQRGKHIWHLYLCILDYDSKKRITQEELAKVAGFSAIRVFGLVHTSDILTRRIAEHNDKVLKTIATKHFSVPAHFFDDPL